MVLEQDLTLVNKVNRLLRWGHWFTFFNVIIALVVTASYFVADPLPHDGLGWLYLLLTWFGHTAFLCFLYFILTIFPLSLLFPSQRHVRGLGAIIATLGLVVLIFDAYVYQQLGYHAGAASYEQTVDLLRQQVVTNLRNFLLIVGSVAALLLMAELTISNFCWKKTERLRQSSLGPWALRFFLSSFVASHVLHIWADANQNYSITKLDHVLPLTYPATARSVLARYELLDTASLQQHPAAASIRTLTPHQSAILCTASPPATPVLVWVVPQVSDALAAQLALDGFRTLPQHLAPMDAHSALVNLLYADFAPAHQRLDQPPHWLSQLPAHFVDLSMSPGWQAQLPWFQAKASHPQSSLKIQLLDNDSALPGLAPANAAQTPSIVIEATAHIGQGLANDSLLGYSRVFYRWPALQQRRIDELTQHLDLIPTLLAHSGCFNQQLWPGENLFAPSQIPRLNILPGQVYAVRKDKLLRVNDDGSYHVSSAGTGVRLAQKMDIPMLIDALKRLQPGQEAIQPVVQPDKAP